MKNIIYIIICSFLIIGLTGCKNNETKEEKNNNSSRSILLDVLMEKNILMNKK